MVAYAKYVLILVVMEYTQWDVLETVGKGVAGDVLILVVMEYTQWEGNSSRNVLKSLVLILVVMEYTQWVQKCTH